MTRLIWILPSCAALAVGCASSPSNTSAAVDDADGSVAAAGDAGLPGVSAGDAATDATSASDAGGDASGDSGSAPDGGDAAAPTGMTWPPDQIFPSFAPVGPLDVVMTSGRAADMLTLLTTLQGLVNRTRPRIFLSDDGVATKLWLNEMKATTTVVADPLTLVTKYRSEIAGIVVTDDAVADTLNLATTIAGVQGGIVASPALAATLTAAPYNLPTLADLRTNHFASKLDVYRYELAQLAPVCTHRLIVGLTPGIPDHLRDYAVATKAMMVWLDPTKADEKALLGQFLGLLPPNSPYMGWWTSEGDGVQAAATYGVPVYAADWSLNLTVLGGTPRGSTPPPAPPPPPLENKLYVAIFMSDGDNLQEDEGLVPLKWSDSSRGSVPINWTLSPALVDVAPVILRYFQRTATPNDVLVSGPSGLGYTYPAAWPTASFDAYTKVTGQYMDTAGFRVATLWNNGADLSAANAQSYLTNAPGLVGLTIQDSTTPRQLIGGKLPIERMTLSYGDNETIVESGVDAALKTYDGSKPVFAAVQGNMNNGAIHPGAFANVQATYERNTNVVFVRADHFFSLLSRYDAPPAHLVLSGDFNGDKKTDALFVYAGNGDVWLGASDGAQLAWSKAGNVAGFGNLLDGGHPIYTGDFNSDGKTDLAFYYPGDGRFWLGASSGTAIQWSTLSTTSLGNVLDGKHRVHVADYDGDGKTDVSVYDAASGNWSLGISSGTALTWSNAGSTSGFGNLLDGSHVFYDGDFDGDGKTDVLFYYNGDKNLWLGRSTGSAFTWSNVGNTSGFGNLVDHGHRLFAGDFDGDKKTDLLFYYAGDQNWWLGLSTGSGFTWSQASNTPGAAFLDWNHRGYTLDFDGDGKLDVVFEDSASGDWTVGRSDGHTLTWKTAGNTKAYGDLADTRHLLFTGDFDGDGRFEPLGYDAASGDWRMSRSDGVSLAWHAAGNTSGFGDLTH